MESINITEALERDPKYQEGLRVYQDSEKKAVAVSQEIATKLIDAIVKKEDKFNITTALLAVSKALTHLTSYLYDTEDEFLSDVQKARTAVVTDVIPALLNPQPCGKCKACKDGRFHECENPDVRGDYTSTRFLPIICNMLIEYDLFNKILHMYTAGNDEAQENSEKSSSDVASEDKIKEESGNGNKQPADK